MLSLSHVIFSVNICSVITKFTRSPTCCESMNHQPACTLFIVRFSWVLVWGAERWKWCFSAWICWRKTCAGPGDRLMVIHSFKWDLLEEGNIWTSLKGPNWGALHHVLAYVVQAGLGEEVLNSVGYSLSHWTSPTVNQNFLIFFSTVATRGRCTALFLGSY